MDIFAHHFYPTTYGHNEQKKLLLSHAGSFVQTLSILMIFELVAKKNCYCLGHSILRQQLHLLRHVIGIFSIFFSALETKLFLERLLQVCRGPKMFSEMLLRANNSPTTVVLIHCPSYLHSWPEQKLEIRYTQTAYVIVLFRTACKTKGTTSIASCRYFIFFSLKVIKQVAIFTHFN